MLGLALILTGLVATADDGASVTGHLSATQQEAQEGYFAVGQETVMVVQQGSRLHKWLASHIGQRITVTMEPDTTTESPTSRMPASAAGTTPRTR